MPEGERPKSIYTLGSGRSLRWINWLLFGHPGVGKTPLWGTGGRDLLLLDMDGGTESAEAFGRDCDVAPTTDFKELSDLYQYFRYGSGCKDYSWVVWDGITLFMDRVLIDELVADAAAQNPKQSGDVASQREYLVLQNRISDYVRRFCGLPINFGISAHVMSGEDPEGNTLYLPHIPGKKGEFSTKISGYMNLVTYYGIAKGGDRRILTETQEYYFSRDRFHAVRTPMKDGTSRGRLTNPTVPKVEQLINQAKARRARSRSNGQDQGASRQRRRPAGRVRR